MPRRLSGGSGGPRVAALQVRRRRCGGHRTREGQAPPLRVRCHACGGRRTRAIRESPLRVRLTGYMRRRAGTRAPPSVRRKRRPTGGRPTGAAPPVRRSSDTGGASPSPTGALIVRYLVWAGLAPPARQALGHTAAPRRIRTGLPTPPYQNPSASADTTTRRQAHFTTAPAVISRPQGHFTRPSGRISRRRKPSFHARKGIPAHPCFSPARMIKSVTESIFRHRRIQR